MIFKIKNIIKTNLEIKGKKEPICRNPWIWFSATLLLQITNSLISHYL